MPRILTNLSVFAVIATWLAFCIVYLNEPIAPVTPDFSPVSMSYIAVSLAQGAIGATIVVTPLVVLRDRWFGIHWNALSLVLYVVFRVVVDGQFPPVAYSVLAIVALCIAGIYQGSVKTYTSGFAASLERSQTNTSVVLGKAAREFVAQRAGTALVKIIPLWAWALAVVSVVVSCVWGAYDINKMNNARVGAVTATAVVTSVEDGYPVLAVPELSDMACDPYIEQPLEVGDEITVFANPLYDWCEGINDPFDPSGAGLWGGTGLAVLLAEAVRAFNSRRLFVRVLQQGSSLGANTFGGINQPSSIDAFAPLKALPVAIDPEEELALQSGILRIRAVDALGSTHETAFNAGHANQLGSGRVRFAGYRREPGFLQFLEFQKPDELGFGIVEQEFFGIPRWIKGEKTGPTEAGHSQEPSDWDDDEAFEAWLEEHETEHTWTESKVDAQELAQLAAQEPTAYVLDASVTQDYALVYSEKSRMFIRVRFGDAMPVTAGSGFFSDIAISEGLGSIDFT